MSAKKPECDWRDDGEKWDTGCGQAHQFFTDGPVENHYRFCPYCGKSLKVRRPR